MNDRKNEIKQFASELNRGDIENKDLFWDIAVELILVNIILYHIEKLNREGLVCCETKEFIDKFDGFIDGMAKDTFDSALVGAGMRYAQSF